MSDHFSYLLDDPAREFFTKAAGDAAERIYGIPATAQVPMKKEASAPSAETAFEKIASRLDRDIGILKTAGPCGIDFGMCKRANVYIDVLLANSELTENEFAEVFDKVAAEAISTDISAAIEQLTTDCPEDMLPWLEHEMFKIGYELAADAEMEKQAIIGLLRAAGRGIGKALVHAPATASAVKAGLGAGGRAIVRPFAQAGKGIKGGMGWLKAQRGAATARAASGALGKIRAGGPMARAYKQSLIKSHQAGRAAEVAGLKKLREAGGQLSPKQLKMLGKEERKALRAAKPPETPAAPAGTTAPKTAPQETLKAREQTKAIETEAQRERAAAEAAGATREGKVLPFEQRGTGTTGPAPKPAPTPDPADLKPVTPAAAEQAGAPKGVIDKLRTEGWNALTGAEKLQVAGGAYVGGKVVFGEGL